MDCERRQIVLPRGPKGICHDEFFYGIETGKADEISQNIEKALKIIEDALSKDIPTFITNIMEGNQISHDEKWNIAALMSLLWVRGPVMRSQINNTSEDMMKQMLAYMFSGPIGDDIITRANEESGVEITEDIKDAYKKMMQEGEFSVKFNNCLHLGMFKEMTGYANLFNAQHWTVHISKASKKFITSDNPVAMHIPKRAGWYGPTFLERTHYFSLTPEICIQARYASNKCGKNLVRKTLFEKDRETILMLNMQIVQMAHQYAYATDRGSLEDILNFVRLMDS